MASPNIGHRCCATPSSCCSMQCAGRIEPPCAGESSLELLISSCKSYRHLLPGLHTLGPGCVDPICVSWLCSRGRGTTQVFGAPTPQLVQLSVQPGWRADQFMRYGKSEECIAAFTKLKLCSTSCKRRIRCKNNTGASRDADIRRALGAG